MMGLHSGHWSHIMPYCVVWARCSPHCCGATKERLNSHITNIKLLCTETELHRAVHPCTTKAFQYVINARLTTSTLQLPTHGLIFIRLKRRLLVRLLIFTYFLKIVSNVIINFFTFL